MRDTRVAQSDATYRERYGNANMTNYVVGATEGRRRKHSAAAVIVRCMGILLILVACVGAAHNALGQDRSPEVVLTLAEKGDSQAQFDLGVMYLYGKGVPKNPETAFSWFKKAAEQGHAAAQYAVGRMYYYGQGVAQDGKEAARWFRKSADKGFADAQFALGVMYQFGKSVDKDLNEAARWYESAADSGLAAAQYALGTMYTLGDGVVKDAEAGLQWLRKAAAQNYEPATRTIVILQSGDPDIEVKIRGIQAEVSTTF